MGEVCVRGTMWSRNNGRRELKVSCKGMTAKKKMGKFVGGGGGGGELGGWADQSRKKKEENLLGGAKREIKTSQPLKGGTNERKDRRV